MKLHRHQSEVDDLHQGPHHEVRLQRRDVHVAELVRDRPTAAALRHGHGREEAADAEGGEDQLVEGHALHRRAEGAVLGDGERARQEAEPLELHGRHREPVRHEPGQPLEVEGRRQQLRVRDQLPVAPRVLLVQVVDLDRHRVVLRYAARLSQRSLSHRCDGLGYGVGDASEDGVRYHHGKY